MSTIKEIAAKVADSVTLGDEDENGTCFPVIEDIDHLATFIEQGIEAYRSSIDINYYANIVNAAENGGYMGRPSQVRKALKELVAILEGK